MFACLPTVWSWKAGFGQLCSSVSNQHQGFEWPCYPGCQRLSIPDLLSSEREITQTYLCSQSSVATPGKQTSLDKLHVVPGHGRITSVQGVYPIRTLNIKSLQNRQSVTDMCIKLWALSPDDERGFTKSTRQKSTPRPQSSWPGFSLLRRR